MEDNVKKELNDLKNIVKRWYAFYLNCADGHKYDQIHVEEFEEVVSLQLLPYLQRLSECKHINRKELGAFYAWLIKTRSDLSSAIAEVKPKEKEDPIVTLLKNLGLTDKQKEAVTDYLEERNGH